MGRILAKMTNGMSAVEFVKCCHNLICHRLLSRHENAFVIYCGSKKFPIMGRNMVELISWRLVGNAFPALVRSSLACNCTALVRSLSCKNFSPLFNTWNILKMYSRTKLAHSEDVGQIELVWIHPLFTLHLEPTHAQFFAISWCHPSISNKHYSFVFIHFVHSTG